MEMSAVYKADIDIANADTRMNHCVGRLLRTGINMQIQNELLLITNSTDILAIERFSLPYKKAST